MLIVGNLVINWYFDQLINQSQGNGWMSQPKSWPDSRLLSAVTLKPSLDLGC